MVSADVKTYLGSLARRLHLDPRETREIIMELQSHLEDKAAELESDGLDREAAMARAMAEMGRPDAVA